MRKFVAIAAVLFAVATPAASADLRPIATKAPPAVAPNPYNWSGFYVGLHIGYGWADKDYINTFSSFGLPLDISVDGANVDGVVGGGQVGFNWQIGQWMTDLEPPAILAGFLAFLGASASSSPQLNQRGLSSM